MSDERSFDLRLMRYTTIFYCLLQNVPASCFELRQENHGWEENLFIYIYQEWTDVWMHVYTSMAERIPR